MNKANAIVIFTATISLTACTAKTENIPSSPEPTSIPSITNSQKESQQISPITEKKELNVPQEINAEIAGKYAIYAMMASNSYHKTKRVKFAVEKAGWIQIDLQGKKTSRPTKENKSGLAYDIYEKQGSNEVVFAIRGTDSKLKDYGLANFSIPPLNKQYQEINKEFGDYKKNHPNKSFVVTGHSLGGGLAFSVSVHQGVDAVTFDPSPRIFDGRNNIHLPAKRIAIYEDGEILEKFRRHSKKFSEVVPYEDIYECKFDFGKASKHRGDFIARGLLQLGATVNPDLVPVLNALIK